MCLDLRVFDDWEERKQSSKESNNYKDEVVKVNFNVVSKRTGITYEVYAVRDSCFLIFFNGEFKWQSMSHFRPTKKTEQERLGLTDKKEPLFRSQKNTVTFP